MWKPTGTNQRHNGSFIIRSQLLTSHTGTNDIPLGLKRRLGDSDGSVSPQARSTGTSLSPSGERGRDPTPKSKLT